MTKELQMIKSKEENRNTCAKCAHYNERFRSCDRRHVYGVSELSECENFASRNAVKGS